MGIRSHFGSRSVCSWLVTCFGCPAMSAVACAISPGGQPRIRCDTSLTVADIADVLEKYMIHKGTRDLLKLLGGLSSITWKHAPKLDLMLGYADLMTYLLTSSGASKIGHVLVKQAVLAAHQSEAGACLFGRSTDTVETLAMRASFGIRVILQKFRDTAKCHKMRAILLAEASLQPSIHCTDTQTYHSFSTCKNMSPVVGLIGACAKKWGWGVLSEIAIILMIQN